MVMTVSVLVSHLEVLVEYKPWWQNFDRFSLDQYKNMENRPDWVKFITHLLPSHTQLEWNYYAGYGILTFASEEDYINFVLKWS